MARILLRFGKKILIIETMILLSKFTLNICVDTFKPVFLSLWISLMILLCSLHQLNSKGGGEGRGMRGSRFPWCRCQTTVYPVFTFDGEKGASFSPSLHTWVHVSSFYLDLFPMCFRINDRSFVPVDRALNYQFLCSLKRIIVRSNNRQAFANTKKAQQALGNST